MNLERKKNGFLAILFDLKRLTVRLRLLEQYSERFAHSNEPLDHAKL